MSMMQLAGFSAAAVAGLAIVMLMVVDVVANLFTSVRSIFQLY